MVASGARTGPVSLDEQGSPTSRPAARCSRHRAGLHSVTLLGSVWTLHHPIERHQPKLRSANKQVEHGHRRRDLAPTSSMALMLQKSQPRTGHTRNGRMTWKRSPEEKPHTDASQGTDTDGRTEVRIGERALRWVLQARVTKTSSRGTPTFHRSRLGHVSFRLARDAPTFWRSRPPKTLTQDTRLSVSTSWVGEKTCTG